MLIKKISEENTFKKTTNRHEFEVNGKKVECLEHNYYSADDCDYDSEIVWNEKDLEALTEEEREIINDNEVELLDLPENEEENYD